MLSLGSQPSCYAAPSPTCLHYFNPKFPMKYPSSIKPSITINSITIPECSTTTSQNHLIIPFPSPHFHFCHFLLQNAPSLPFYSLSTLKFLYNSNLSLSVSNLPFQNHSIYKPSYLSKNTALWFWIFTPQLSMSF